MNQIEQLEEHRETLEKRVERRDEVLKLYDNPLFKKHILDGFCRDDAARCVGAAGNPGISERDETQMLNMAMAGGHLTRYLRTAIQQGDQAESDLQQIDQQLDQMRAEDADEKPAE